MSTLEGRILIVEDTAPVRRIIKRKLITAGIPEEQIDEAENEAKALEYIVSQAYRVILLDWDLDMEAEENTQAGGETVGLAIRSSEINRSAHVINISGTNDNPRADVWLNIKGKETSMEDFVAYVLESRSRN